MPDYSYNWPFDFFSLIELAKVSAQHEFTKLPLVETEDGESKFDPSLIGEFPAKLFPQLSKLPSDAPEVDRSQSDRRAGARRGRIATIPRDPVRSPVDPSRLPGFGLTIAQLPAQTNTLMPMIANIGVLAGAATQNRVVDPAGARRMTNNVQVSSAPTQAVNQTMNTSMAFQTPTANTMANPSVLNIGAGYGGPGLNKGGIELDF